MQKIKKIRHPNQDINVLIKVAKITIWVVAQVQMEEIVFMAVRNCQASLPPAARLLKGCNRSLYHCFFLPYDGNGLSKGSKARSFSQSGIGDSNDQDSSLKSQRVHSPPKP